MTKGSWLFNKRSPLIQSLYLPLSLSFNVNFTAAATTIIRVPSPFFFYYHIRIQLLSGVLHLLNWLLFLYFWICRLRASSDTGRLSIHECTINIIACARTINEMHSLMMWTVMNSLNPNQLNWHSKYYAKTLFSVFGLYKTRHIYLDFEVRLFSFIETFPFRTI